MLQLLEQPPHLQEEVEEDYSEELGLIPHQLLEELDYLARIPHQLPEELQEAEREMLGIQKEYAEQVKEGGQEPAREDSEDKKEKLVEDLKKFSAVTASVTGLSIPVEALEEMLKVLMQQETKGGKKEEGQPQPKPMRSRPGEDAEEPQVGRAREVPRRQAEEPRARSRSRGGEEQGRRQD